MHWIDVFVHRVMVVHVELHHRHDRFEFGNKGRQHTELVHPAQRAFRVAVFQQQIKKEPLLGFWHRAQIRRRSDVQVGGDKAHGIRVDQHRPVRKAFLEDMQQVQPDL